MLVSDVPARNRHSELVDLAWALLRGTAGDWLTWAVSPLVLVVPYEPGRHSEFSIKK